MPTPSSVPPAPTARTPDVSVVVTARDPARLPSAVSAVLRQTLHNLEVVVAADAAEVATTAAVRDLAIRHPDRVRLAASAPGGAAARNTGLDAARAPFVVFLDADDSLERHAVKNLLIVAEATGADVVSGPCIVDGAHPEHQSPRPLARLYPGHAVHEGIGAAPDLLLDPSCAGKLFRRDLLTGDGIRFPDSDRHGDLMVTTLAYCAAARIAVVPYEVCRSSRPAFAECDGRSWVDDVRDRIAVHEATDAHLRARGREHLRAVKDRAWVLADLRHGLGDLWLHDESDQRRWLDVVATYAERIDPAALETLGRLPRAATYLVRERDLACARTTGELWADGRTAGRLTVRDGRAYLCAHRLDSAEGRDALDVTALHLHTAPFGRRALLNRLLSVEDVGGSTVLTGVVTDPVGDVQEDAAVRVVLQLRSPDGRHHIDVTETDASVRSGEIRWRAVLGGASRPRLDARAAGWRLWTSVDCSGSRNAAAVLARPGLAEGVPVRWRGAGHAPAFRAVLRLAGTEDRTVAVRFHHTSVAGRAAAAAGERLRRSALWADVDHFLGWTAARAVKGLGYRLVLARLPVRRGTAVFESQLGRGYTDSPKYVYRALRAGGDRRRVVWSYAADPSGWPDDAVLVRRDTWRYYYELARAEHWVDNQGLPSIARRRRATTYLQTWHGSPYKTMGFDQPALRYRSSARQDDFATSVARWTHFCVQSPFAEAAFATAFRHRAQVLRTGYPRNDPLLQPDAAALGRRLRSRLELPDDRHVVLYAPTFRDWRRGTGPAEPFPLDLDRLSEAVGATTYLLVRTHYLEHGRVPTRHASFARDVSDHPDVTELMLAADALVTDYSSVMFDFALLRRPMLFYAYDLDLYTLSRGAYFDLEAHAPGPVVRTEEDVAAWLADPTAGSAAFADRYDRFVAEFCTFETGRAAAEAVAAVFGQAS